MWTWTIRNIIHIKLFALYVNRFKLLPEAKRILSIVLSLPVLVRPYLVSLIKARILREHRTARDSTEAGWHKLRIFTACPTTPNAFISSNVFWRPFGVVYNAHLCQDSCTHKASLQNLHKNNFDRKNRKSFILFLFCIWDDLFLFISALQL